MRALGVEVGLARALAGSVRVGRENSRPVRCASCRAACLPGQARRVYLAAWQWRSVYCCLARCVPTGER